MRISRRRGTPEQVPPKTHLGLRRRPVPGRLPARHRRSDYPIATSLPAEWVPDKHRGRLLGILILAWYVGAAAANAVGCVMSEIAGNGSWRWMLASGAVLSALILLTRIGTPESPLRLVNKGRTADAQKAIRKALDRTVPVEELLAASVAEQPVQQNRFRDLFQGACLRRTLFCGSACVGSRRCSPCSPSARPSWLLRAGGGQREQSRLGADQRRVRTGLYPRAAPGGPGGAPPRHRVVVPGSTQPGSGSGERRDSLRESGLGRSWPDRAPNRATCSRPAACRCMSAGLRSPFRRHGKFARPTS
ncbi:MFS transporter [Streptomyces sp. NPDC014995]|uniref:MFS transporter n=1 Tax=Streptomyces sp. NPDC014995 TaxID=3364936 RepID=UPI0036FAE8D2